MSMKALLIAMAAGALLAIVAAMLIAHFVTVW